MATTIFVCSKCGKKASWEDAKRKGWLIAPHRKTEGQMVIRCPRHITEYAKKMAR